VTAHLAAALDLGSTRLKVATLDAAGRLEVAGEAPFPVLELDGSRYEIDVPALVERATALLARVPRALPLGIASQRSSYVLWSRADGRPLAPALSWRDRRAAPWCDARPELAQRIAPTTGLRLSPHYAGPKLAQALAADAALPGLARSGAALWGTLDTFLMWTWSGGRVHAIDATMAARTSMADPASASWSDELLQAFGVPRAMLPRIVDTAGRDDRLVDGRKVAASIADQPSGLVAVARAGDVLVNLGTGSFVLRSVPAFAPRPGYLCGPALAFRGATRFALEGTINGGGSTLARFLAPEEDVPASDPDPDLFASPDESGLGAPHWIAAAGLAFSREGASDAAKRRAWLEGLVFRVREIAGDIASDADRVLLSGGLASEPFVAPALAACLRRAVELVDEPEATLLGAARLAAGLDPFAASVTTTIDPDPRLAWIASKYPRWREWMRRDVLGPAHRAERGGSTSATTGK
jgi:glycerol kinase